MSLDPNAYWRNRLATAGLREALQARIRQDETFAAIRKLGLTVRKVAGEIRVAWPRDEASAYYTNDLQDALGTARAMATRKRAYATD